MDHQYRELRRELRHFEVLVLDKLDKITRRLKIMSLDLTALTAEVAEVKSVEASAVVLIQGIAQQIADAVAHATDDPAAQAAVNDLAAQLKSATDALAAAVAAGTPHADPAPAPEAPAPDAPTA